MKSGTRIVPVNAIMDTMDEAEFEMEGGSGKEDASTAVLVGGREATDGRREFGAGRVRVEGGAALRG